MLVLSRRGGESIFIELDETLKNRPAGELFAAGPIEIAVISTGESFARIGIQAPEGLRILRSELRNKGF